ncbi:MAG: cytochrome C biogenesis protein cycl [Rickettsiales bacterium]|jgi:cytochrome c-type biogenesis protein CcmH|nr:cytochrome C biogenesis protein cycl [Rickettsiales bacterium]MBC36490.1 cytochrome C biogenesis protein cycl [Rickettsiales bacterium]MCH2677304.1 cytochrome c-type biogenesis protein CcmH [Alphaproteobacteria bacterium]HAE75973.1 cytochrome C biogenesis protein cycl [Alphaproteobacteria bacterium]|tara:strand:- start:344 stop:748 length:405 start_codon:yes stop_codon:yes gene_type:complete
MINLKSFLALVAIVILPNSEAICVEPEEILDNKNLEERARNISKTLRCLVCQNQSIDESEAALAKDLRLIVRERLKLGDNDEEVINFIRERYGDFVLLDPPVNKKTIVLWLSPILILIIWLIALTRVARKKKSL